MANTTKKTNEQNIPSTAPADKTFTQEEVQKMIAEALKQNASIPNVVIEKKEVVELCYAGPMAKGTVFHMHDIGNINKQFGTLTVEKERFLRNIDYKAEARLKDRTLIVVSGLTEEERASYDINYTPDEILDKAAFKRLLDMSVEDICAEFNRVCTGHKRIIATLFIDAYNAKDARATQEKVAALNTLSKAIDPDGMFTPILEDMGEQLAK